MAARIPAVWGIDLGQCALKAIRLEMKDGQVVATAFEYIEHPKILSQPDADPDELSREALNQFLSRNKIKGDLVAISVPGQSGLARFVKLPPVDEKKVADIVKFEAKQQIPFPLDEVVWDYQRLNKGDVIDGLALETEIGLFAIKRDMVNRAIRQFKDVNVEVHLVQMAPLALCNFISYDLLGIGFEGGDAEAEKTNECIVALEIGTDNSNLVITNGGRIIWQRPIPIGGNHFTRALTKELKLTFAKAEHLKKNAAKSPDLKKILSSLKQVLNDFVGEVQRSLGYFTNTHRNAEIKYMVGLGNAFRLPGLQKFLQEKLQLEVRKFQKLERATGESVIAAPTFHENVMSFGVAYGLALQGLKEARLQTNLLPYEVRLERVIRGKKPWAVATAASLLFGMFLLAFARGMEKNAVVNDVNVKGQKKLEDAIKQLESAKQQVDAEKQSLDTTLAQLERVSVGGKDRINWQLLLQYVNMAAPMPDGKNLHAQTRGLIHTKRDYWDGDKEAQAAFENYEKKKLNQLSNLSPADAAKLDAEIKTSLIQVNIAGINALYTENLDPYFRKIYADGEVLSGMEKAEAIRVTSFAKGKDAEGQTKLPASGWVVEVRGYTYHKKGEQFVIDTILENLGNPTEEMKKHPAFAQVKSRIKDKASFLFLYKNKKIENPVPGQFALISTSVISTLIKGDAKKIDDNIMAKDKPDAGAVKVDPKKERGNWKPIGEVASVILGGGGGGGGGGGVEPGDPRGNPRGIGLVDQAPGVDAKDAKAPAKSVAVPRTEFVILFIWAEPLAVGVQAAKKEE